MHAKWNPSYHNQLYGDNPKFNHGYFWRKKFFPMVIFKAALFKGISWNQLHRASILFQLDLFFATIFNLRLRISVFFKILHFSKLNIKISSNTEELQNSAFQFAEIGLGQYSWMFCSCNGYLLKYHGCYTVWDNLAQ